MRFSKIRISFHQAHFRSPDLPAGTFLLYASRLEPPTVGMPTRLVCGLVWMLLELLYLQAHGLHGKISVLRSSSGHTQKIYFFPFSGPLFRAFLVPSRSLRYSSHNWRHLSECCVIKLIVQGGCGLRCWRRMNLWSWAKLNSFRSVLFFHQTLLIGRYQFYWIFVTI